MYIRIAFSIELRLRVSRSLRSLANYNALVAKESELRLLFRIQSYDNGAITVAKVSLYSTFTRSTVSFDSV